MKLIENKITVALLALMFSVQSFYSQEKFNIKDTIYLYFRETNSKQTFFQHFKNKKYGEYTYRIDKNKIYYFFHSTRCPEEKKIKKSFLRKNKNRIITYDNIKKFDSTLDFTDIFTKAKKIYLIDSKYAKKNNLLMIEVMCDNKWYLRQIE